MHPWKEVSSGSSCVTVLSWNPPPCILFSFKLKGTEEAEEAEVDEVVLQGKEVVL